MDSAQVRIALVGAGGMSFGPIMTYDVIRSEKLKGSTLVLVDTDEKKLDVAWAIASRINEACGNPIIIEREQDTERGVAGAEYIMTSVEVGRWERWKEDLEIPKKHGSTQVMGENGGPGGVFHSLRSIKLILEICRQIERTAPDAFLLNLTNPMSRVTLAISRATKLRAVGMCHEFGGGFARLVSMLLLPPAKIRANASGINHFTWFYEIENAETGEDLYPKLRTHAKLLPFLHQPLVRRCFREFGLYPTSSDSHIGEYLPFVSEEAGPMYNPHKFYHFDWKARGWLSEQYANGLFWLPVKMLPMSPEEQVPIIQAMATGDTSARFNAVNVPNKGYVPNMPEGCIVEVPSRCDSRNLLPETVPPIHEPLAEIMRLQVGLQDKIVDSAINGDPELAFEALVADPLSPPDEKSCRRMFDEMVSLQREQLPF